MDNWHEVCEVSDLPPGTHRVISMKGISVLVINVEEQYFAVENQCPHDGAPLAGGEIEGDQIICPRHSARFCLRTGEVLAPPATEDIDSYPVRIVDGTLEIFMP